MAYRLRQRANVQEGLRRIAVQQIDRAIDEIRKNRLDCHKTVHQVRKRCKKIRGLARLVRCSFDDFGRENSFFRDAARQLSYVRDAQSTIECYRALVERFSCDEVRGRFAVIHDQLHSRRQEVVHDQVDVENRLDEILRKLQTARGRAESWKLSKQEFSAIGGGLCKTYRRARNAMKLARSMPSAENVHQWRKRVKYHWYHARLLRRMWREMMSAHIAATGKLADILGEDHDLAVLRATLLRDRESFGPRDIVAECVHLIQRRRTELQTAAWPMGERVLAEKPKQLSKRFHQYWCTWRQ